MTHLPGRDFQALRDAIKEEARYQMARGDVALAESLARIWQSAERTLIEAQHEPSLY
jgi:hypothetical protein